MINNSINLKISSIIISLITIFIIIIGCSSIKSTTKEESENIKTFTVNEFKEKAQEYMLNASSGKIDKIIVKVKKGEKIPVNIIFEMPFAKLNSTSNAELEFMQDIYFMISQNEFYISKDKLEWAPIQDMDAIKNIFGIQNGIISVGLSVKENEEAKLDFIVKAK